MDCFAILERVRRTKKPVLITQLWRAGGRDHTCFTRFNAGRRLAGFSGRDWPHCGWHCQPMA